MVRLCCCVQVLSHGRAMPLLFSWFDAKARWKYSMRLRAVPCAHGTAAPMGCAVRRLGLSRGRCRGLQDVLVGAAGAIRVNLLLAYPSGTAIDES